MIDINSYIDDKENRFYMARFFDELKTAFAKKGATPGESGQFAYAVMVCAVADELRRRPWLGDCFVSLAIKPFDDTIKAMKKKFGDL